MKKTLRLSKPQGAAFDHDRMTRFLAVLERWCNHHARRGYTIRSEPEAGPGTMVWKAVKEDVVDRPRGFRNF